jgi:hypothetical protein
VLDPDSPYVAYCPPGALDDARETLDRGGHTYHELEEHPILEGQEEIILIDTSVEIEVPPLDIAHFWWEASEMRHWMSAPLIPHPLPSPPIITGSTN